MTTVVVLTLLGGACYGVAAVLQHQAAEAQPPELTMRFGLLLRLVRRPLWVVGNLLDMAGYAFQLLALRTGPLTLVEPLLVVSLIFAFPVSAMLGHRNVSMAETGAAVVVAGGLGLFLAFARPSAVRLDAPFPVLFLLTVIIALALGTGTLVARHSVRSRAGLVLAGSAGVAFGYMAAMTAVSWQLITHGALHALASWQPYAVIVSGAVGILLTQSAFNAGHLRLTLPTMTVVQPIVAIAIGLFVFGEKIGSHGLAPFWEVLGLAVMVIGVFALAQPQFPD